MGLFSGRNLSFFGTVAARHQGGEIVSLVSLPDVLSFLFWFVGICVVSYCLFLILFCLLFVVSVDRRQRAEQEAAESETVTKVEAMT